jgi:(p)ppGpp synthase/HD superfamily hydrolase
MKLLAKMYALVAESFKDVTDKQGRPYFEHCLHVMQTCGLTDENSLCIALGHDLIEDIPHCNYFFLKEEFNDEIAEGINCLTHKMGDYFDYVKTIPLNPIVGKKCTAIKKADLRHNMDASRLHGLTKKDFDRMEKYMRAYTYLKSI